MKNSKLFFISFLLSLPILLFLLKNAFVHSSNLRPTGFSTDEDILYMSYAHQYLDDHKATIAYSNPFDSDPASSKIYFQPINFLFAFLMHLGLPPGNCFTIFGFAMSFACIFLGLKILKKLYPQSKHTSITGLLFTWGGGILAISGLLISFCFKNYASTSWVDGIYLLDPAKGWWGLNWGRTLFLPQEAYYHFLFLLCIYFILQKKWLIVFFATFFLSISHPFTGIELLSIIIAWLAVEKIIFKNQEIPNSLLVGILFITCFHLWYYLIFLNKYPEHRLLFQQYTLAWTYSLRIAIPAYILVALLSIANIQFNKSFKNPIKVPHQRLFLCWALISFLLSKHEWFIKPMQPIHFTRGYTWAGLFLFSLPVIQQIIEYLKRTAKLKIVLGVFVMIFISDNIFWTFNLLRGKNDVEWEGHISPETEQVLNFLSKTSTPNDLIIGNAKLVNYLANVYSKANSWVSHPYNTPEIEKRNAEMGQYFQTGVKPKEWENRHILLLLNKKDSIRILPSLETQKKFENSTYVIFTP